MPVYLIPIVILIFAAVGTLPVAWAHSVQTGPGSSLALLLEASIVLSLAVAFLFYVCGLRQLWRNAHAGAGISRMQAFCFLSGLAFLVIALLSPVDALGNELFSMHMVQHEIMMLLAAPLLVAGKPLSAFIWAFSPLWRRRIGQATKILAIRKTWSCLNSPLIAWMLHAIILWTWHFPSLFQASLKNDAVHALQHFSFLLSALLFWSSLIRQHHRVQYKNANYATAALYVLTTLIHTGVLGALLTFSSHAWYPFYEGKTEYWGLTLLEDQQLGGLIMWVPAGFILIFAGLAFSAKAIAPQGQGTKAASHMESGT